jgi:Protein of unknown function (DUF3185)
MREGASVGPRHTFTPPGSSMASLGAAAGIADLHKRRAAAIRGSMKKVIRGFCLVGGVGLLVWGRNISQSIGSQVVQVFTGSPAERAIYAYTAGTVLLLGGFFCLFTGKK